MSTTDLDSFTAGGKGGGVGSGRHLRDLVYSSLGWLIFLTFWELVSTQFEGTVLPGPITVAKETWAILSTGQFFTHLQWTVFRTGLGFLVALAAGAAVGYLMGRYRYWRSFFRDGVSISGLIPAIAYAVMMLVLFGISLVGPVVAVALFSLPYVAINVAEGVEGVDAELLEMSRAYRCSSARIRRHIVFPAIVPYLFAGARLAFAVGWRIEALTEVIGGRNGVGFQMRVAYLQFAIPRLLAWTFVFVLFMLMVERLVLLPIENRLLAWRPAEWSISP